jgi:hypothetical protein
MKSTATCRDIEGIFSKWVEQASRLLNPASRRIPCARQICKRKTSSEGGKPGDYSIPGQANDFKGLTWGCSYGSFWFAFPPKNRPNRVRMADY